MASAVTFQADASLGQDDLSQQAKSLSHEHKENRHAGWLSEYVDAEGLKDPAQQLQHHIHNLRDSFNGKEERDLASMEAKCCAEFVSVVKAGALRNCKDGRKNKYLRKVSTDVDEFCGVAMHYQNVFDVLSNAGDYTSIIWTAVKLLMIYRVNNKELKIEVVNHLERIGEWLTELSAFFYIPKDRLIQGSITKAYTLLLQFLTQALEYYKETKIARAIKNISQPWKLRFQPIISEIQASIQTIHKRIQVIIYASIEQLKEGTMKIGKAVQKGTQDLLSKVGEGQFLILKGQAEMKAAFNALRQSISRQEGHLIEAAKLWDEDIRFELLKEHKHYEVHDDTFLITDIRKENIAKAFEESFPQLVIVKKADAARQRKYRPNMTSMHEEDSQSISNFQWNLMKDRKTSHWATEAISHFLWIEGYQESTTFNWTTKLSMDVLRLATSIHDVVVLSFFPTTKAPKLSPSLILQTFIEQIVNQCWDKDSFSSAKCCRHAFSLSRLQSCGDDFTKLWCLFAVCLDIIQADFIFVILNDVDLVLNACKDHQIQQFFVFLKGLAESKWPVFKILMTSRNNRMPESVDRGAKAMFSCISQQHHSLMSIPRVSQAGSESRMQRQKHRISMIGDSSKYIHDEMLELSSADDAERGERPSSAASSDADLEFVLRNQNNDQKKQSSRKSSVLKHSGDDVPIQDHTEFLLDIGSSDSDIGLDVGEELKRMGSYGKGSNQSSKFFQSSNDDIIQDILNSSESDLDLSDLEIGSKATGPKFAREEDIMVKTGQGVSKEEFILEDS